MNGEGRGVLTAVDISAPLSPNYNPLRETNSQEIGEKP